jgi:signal transduction histidine kinase
MFEAGRSGEDMSTGFGLSIVEQIAELHGWTVDLTDGSDGGARFEFRDVESMPP